MGANSGIIFNRIGAILSVENLLLKYSPIKKLIIVRVQNEEKR